MTPAAATVIVWQLYVTLAFRLRTLAAWIRHVLSTVKVSDCVPPLVTDAHDGVFRPTFERFVVAADEAQSASETEQTPELVTQEQEVPPVSGAATLYW